jgi:hypothetical protein
MPIAVAPNRRSVVAADRPQASWASLLDSSSLNERSGTSTPLQLTANESIADVRSFSTRHVVRYHLDSDGEPPRIWFRRSRWSHRQPARYGLSRPSLPIERLSLSVAALSERTRIPVGDTPAFESATGSFRKNLRILLDVFPRLLAAIHRRLGSSESCSKATGRRCRTAVLSHRRASVRMRSRKRSARGPWEDPRTL